MKCELPRREGVDTIIGDADHHRECIERYKPGLPSKTDRGGTWA